MVRAQIAYAQNRGSAAAELLFSAAKRLEPLDLLMARASYLDALAAASFAGNAAAEIDLVQIAKGALAARPSGTLRPADLLLEGVATRITDGYASGVPMLKEALGALRRVEVSDDEQLRCSLSRIARPSTCGMTRAGICYRTGTWNWLALAALSQRSILRSTPSSSHTPLRGNGPGPTRYWQNSEQCVTSSKVRAQGGVRRYWLPMISHTARSSASSEWALDQSAKECATMRALSAKWSVGNSGPPARASSTYRFDSRYQLSSSHKSTAERYARRLQRNCSSSANFILTDPASFYIRH